MITEETAILVERLLKECSCIEELQLKMKVGGLNWQENSDYHFLIWINSILDFGINSWSPCYHIKINVNDAMFKKWKKYIFDFVHANPDRVISKKRAEDFIRNAIFNPVSIKGLKRCMLIEWMKKHKVNISVLKTK